MKGGEEVPGPDGSFGLCRTESREEGMSLLCSTIRAKHCSTKLVALQRELNINSGLRAIIKDSQIESWRIFNFHTHKFNLGRVATVVLDIDLIVVRGTTPTGIDK